MITIVLENTETGETRSVKGQASFEKPWRVQRVIKEPKQIPARIAFWATKLGLPVPEFLDMARWLLKKDCPFCQLGTQVLKSIDELGDDRAQTVLAEILAAKETNDTARLAEIKKSLWPYDQPVSPRQS